MDNIQFEFPEYKIIATTVGKKIAIKLMPKNTFGVHYEGTFANEIIKLFVTTGCSCFSNGDKVYLSDHNGLTLAFTKVTDDQCVDDRSLLIKLQHENEMLKARVHHLETEAIFWNINLIQFVDVDRSDHCIQFIRPFAVNYINYTSDSGVHQWKIEYTDAEGSDTKTITDTANEGLFTLKNKITVYNIKIYNASGNENGPLGMPSDNNKHYYLRRWYIAFCPPVI